MASQYRQWYVLWVVHEWRLHKSYESMLKLLTYVVKVVVYVSTKENQYLKVIVTWFV